MADSSTQEFLPPNPAPAPVPLEDNVLITFFQNFVVGITGMAGNMVRPRWQPEPPNIPTGSWCAIGIMGRVADTYAAEIHHDDVNGAYDEVRRHEIIRLLTSFYGPAASTNAEIFREGLQLSQNREYLTLANMGLVDSEDLITVPELIKEKWLYRVDLPFSVKRQIVRTYNVLSLQSAQFQLEEDVPASSTSLSVNPKLDSTFILDQSTLA